MADDPESRQFVADQRLPVDEDAENDAGDEDGSESQQAPPLVGEGDDCETLSRFRADGTSACQMRTSCQTGNAGLKLTGERVVTPEGGFNPTWQRHVAAYRLSEPFLGPESVVDLGCGIGHSYHLLSPRVTIGIDIDPGALEGQQRETVVADMVDFYLVLMLAGAGDELQGIKRGILEVADMLAINKADGDNEVYAKRARSEYEMALHLMRGHGGSWHPPVLTCSALLNVGLAALWAKIEEHREKLTATGELAARREKQLVHWMWNMIEERLLAELHAAPGVRTLLPQLESDLRAGRVTATSAATTVLNAFEHTRR